MSALIERKQHHQKQERLDWLALNDDKVHAQSFEELKTTAIQYGSQQSLYGKWQAFKSTVNIASHRHIPLAPPTPHKPWISEATLALIRKRQEAQRANDWPLEKELRRETKQSSRRDRTRCLQNLAGSGEWQSLSELRGGNKAIQTQLRDCGGCIVSAESRAGTLADHLEKIQWGLRLVTLQPDLPRQFSQSSLSRRVC